MDKLIAILNKPLLNIGDEAITLGELVVVPLVFALIFVVAGWIARVVMGARYGVT